MPRMAAGGFHPSAQLARAGLLLAWWSTDDHGTANMTDDGAGLISAWVDRVGGVTVTAATTARPTWAAASFNGALSGLTFDGTASSMVATSFAALPTGAAPCEIWALVDQQATDGTTLRRVIQYGGAASAVDRMMGRSTGNLAQLSDNSTVLTETNGIPFAGAHVVGGAWSGTLLTARVDGRAFKPAATTIVTLATGTTRLRIGAANGASVALPWQGVIRHVIVTGLLNTAQRQQLEAWLAWDGLIPFRLPSGHPFKSRRP